MKLLYGKNLPLLKLMDENSIDTVITDPPYGLKFMGKKWDYNVPSVETWEEILRVTKPGGTLLCFAGSRTQHRMAVNIEDAGWILKDCIMWLYGSGFPKATDISKQLDKGHKRKVVGKNPNARLVKRKKGTAFERPCDTNPNASMKFITEPATPEAKLWNGWKSHGLKPAYEPILVAMKPNEGTYANNALVHGVSGLNIDGGRIGTDKINTIYNPNIQGGNFAGGSKGLKTNKLEGHTDRFPANIILDEEAGAMLGEPSRFFYCAKASKKERNAGCEGLEAKFSPTMNDGIGGKEHNPETATKKNNHHPTVKPLKLMEYLCTLTKTPTGGTVLDPFMGSGTTGLACQNTARDFIGIEMSEEYYKIAKARI